MALLLKSQLKPQNASTTWPDRCRFWRGFDNLTCPVPLVLHAGGGLLINLAISGDFLGAAPIFESCAGSSPYVDSGSTTNALRFYIWKALADGAWASSAVFTIYGLRFGSAKTETLTGWAGRITDTGLDPANVVISTFFPTGSGCPSVAVATLTVYDDGTYTLT